MWYTSEEHCCEVMYLEQNRVVGRSRHVSKSYLPMVSLEEFMTRRQQDQCEINITISS